MPKDYFSPIMLTDGKSTFNVGYDRCCCHIVYIHNCCWQMIFDEAMSGGLVKARVPGKNCSVLEKIRVPNWKLNRMRSLHSFKNNTIK